ncbi:MAG TPA: hypothetical protein VFH83_05350 [Spirochaetia bacterium]|nr:hypothetical protein [Spirochaetia bacterium]
MLQDTPLPDDRCPTCGHAFDTATPMPSNDRSVPAPGDLAVCIACGQILVFNTQMKYEIFLWNEELDPETKGLLRRAQDFIRARLPRIEF